MNKRVRSKSVAILLLLILFSSAFTAAAKNKPSLLVVPARQQAVELAFDMARMRSVFLVSYQQDEEDAAPFMHIWDSTRRQWLETDIERYREAVHFSVTPATVFLLGTPKEFPAVLQEASGWAETVVRMENLSPADLINQLDSHMNFSSREWRQLARNYKLKLKDSNSERRRYGRYGPPGSKTALPPIKIEEEDPSGPLILEPIETPGPVETPALILEPIEETEKVEIPELEKPEAVLPEEPPAPAAVVKEIEIETPAPEPVAKPTVPEPGPEPGAAADDKLDPADK
jgi:hypothetical protein